MITSLLKSENKKEIKKQIVLVTDIPYPREAKIAYSLKENGWNVVLLYKTEPTFDIIPYCSTVYNYSCNDEAYKFALQFEPVIYHLFSRWNYDLAAMFIRNRPGKIVFDTYDLMAGMVKVDFLEKNYPGQLKLERYCLENADGICCRSIETQYAKQKMGYKFKGKRIFFPEYCWNKYDMAIRKNFNGRVSIAMVGNLNIDERYDINDSRNCHLKLAIQLSNHNITSYLYKQNISPASIERVKDKIRGNSNIIIGNITPSKLIDVLSYCHGGLIAAASDILEQPDPNYCLRKKHYGMGNKAFDYIDAGVAIIMDDSSNFLYRLIKRHTTVFDFRSFMLNIDSYLDKLREYLVVNEKDLYKIRDKLSMKKQIGRLITFYETI